MLLVQQVTSVFTDQLDAFQTTVVHGFRQLLASLRASYAIRLESLQGHIAALACHNDEWVAAHDVIDEALNNMSAKSLLSLLFPQAGDMCRALLSPNPPSPLLRAL